MGPTPEQIRAALPERWHKEYDRSISGLTGSPLEVTLDFWDHHSRTLTALGPVTEQERHTGELLRQRDAVLQRSPDAREALRLDGEASGGYRIRFTETAKEQVRERYHEEYDMRRVISERLPDPRAESTVVRPGAESDDFREALIYKWAIAYIAGSDGKKPLIMVTTFNC
ncbi:hypothetical protein [Streptomyces sp. 891-h]|uniref:hypothetical protein n=1 Tax=unclassified Streptomyces TaxID=2593676 RepID=UPI001FA9AFC7|nr:hypothetical protein [Streptomyces sp. 891-h]UNZ20243.1 hypothetical protein HC362_27495 [Streptomyces sp. 891-h]